MNQFIKERDVVIYEGIEIPLDIIKQFPTPSYVVFEELVERNAQILEGLLREQVVRYYWRRKLSLCFRYTRY